MSLLGNLVFFIFGGFVIFFGYLLGGIVLCLTIIGIPFGIQCFKLAGGVLAPFGREVRETEPPGGALAPVSYTHLTLPTNVSMCRSRWSPGD